MNAILYAAQTARHAPPETRADPRPRCAVCGYPLIRPTCWRCADRAKAQAARARRAAASGQRCASCAAPLALTNKSGLCGPCYRHAPKPGRPQGRSAGTDEGCPDCGGTRRTKTGACARCTDRARSRTWHTRRAAAAGKQCTRCQQPLRATNTTGLCRACRRPAPPIPAPPPVVEPSAAPPVLAAHRPTTAAGPRPRPIGVSDGVHCGCCRSALAPLTVGCCPTCWAAIQAGALPSALIRQAAAARPRCTGDAACPHPPLANHSECLKHYNAAHEAA